jgi:acyl-coenzyme A synthetase/AMP-(fatty) acid ligase
VGLAAAGQNEIVAAVLLRSGVEKSDTLKAELLKKAVGSLSAHERPSRIIFVDDLPTVLGGAKVQRDLLQQQLSGGVR